MREKTRGWGFEYQVRVDKVARGATNRFGCR